MTGVISVVLLVAGLAVVLGSWQCWTTRLTGCT
jgi:hypothetical protein